MLQFLTNRAYKIIGSHHLCTSTLHTCNLSQLNLNLRQLSSSIVTRQLRFVCSDITTATTPAHFVAVITSFQEIPVTQTDTRAVAYNLYLARTTGQQFEKWRRR